MRCIYRAENIIDANLVKNALAQAGIPSHVAGEYLTGAAGQLPAFGLVSVLVADVDEAAAAPWSRRSTPPCATHAPLPPSTTIPHGRPPEGMRRGVGGRRGRAEGEGAP